MECYEGNEKSIGDKEISTLCFTLTIEKGKTFLDTDFSSKAFS